MPRIAAEQLIARPAASGRAGTARDFGIGIGTDALGAGLEQIGGQNIDLFNADMDARVGKAVAASAEKLQELLTQEEENPDFDGSKQRFDTARQEILESFREGIQTEKFKDLFNDRVKPIAVNARQRNLDMVRARTLARTRGSATEAITALIDLAEVAATDEEREALLTQADVTLQSVTRHGVYTPQQAATLRIAMNRAVEDAERRNRAQSEVDELLAAGLTERQALTKARQDFNGEMEDDVVDRIKDRYAEQDRFRAEFERKRYDKAINDALAGELSHAEARTLGLSGGELRTVTSTISAVQSANGLQTNWEKYWEIRELLENPATREQGRKQLKDSTHLLDNQPRKDLEKIAADDGAVDTYAQKLKRATAAIRRDTVNKAQDRREAERSLAFRRRVDAEKLRREGKKGETLTSGEVDQLLSDATFEEDLDQQWFGGSNVRGRFAFLPQDIDVDDFTPDERTAARKYLLERGIVTPTPEQMQAAFSELLAQPELLERPLRGGAPLLDPIPRGRLR